MSEPKGSCHATATHIHLALKKSRASPHKKRIDRVAITQQTASSYLQDFEQVYYVYKFIYAP